MLLMSANKTKILHLQTRIMHLKLFKCKTNTESNFNVCLWQTLKTVVKLKKSLYLNMQIERTNSEILIRLSAGTDLVGLQRILDYIKYREIASKSKASQEEIDELANESKSSWWDKNKSKFIKLLLLSIPILFLVDL